MADGPILDQVNIIVSNMPAAVDFYRLLGIEIPDQLPPWDNRHRNSTPRTGASMDFDSDEFAGEWDRGWPGGTGILIGFKLPTREAVDETWKRLAGAGYKSQQQPWDAFWGARYAIVEDPDGHAVGLMSPADGPRSMPHPAPLPA